MFIYRYNKYTGKYYSYDTDFYDIMSPMFDETIHPDNDDFLVNHEMDPRYHLTCAFCNTEFPNRSQLFKHLGYMGINITNEPQPMERRDHQSMHTEERGDYGFSIDNISNNYRENRQHYKIRRRSFASIKKRRERREARRRRNNLTKFLDKLDINTIV